MKTPSLLTIKALLYPVKRAHDKVDEITRAQVDMSTFAKDSSDQRLGGIANEGIFVLLVSTFEVMLGDVLMCYLQEFPEKMEFKDSPFTTEQVVGATFARELWEVKAEALVRSKMYQDVSTVLKYFLTTLSINDCSLDQDQVDKLTELKQTRNLLIHADLVSNSVYLEKAGPAARTSRTGVRLHVDDRYLGDSLITLKSLLIEIERRINAKYGAYTRLAALERLWNFMFVNPEITPFSNYWQIDVAEDVIRPRNNPEAELRLSGAEKLFLALWRNCLNGIPISKQEGWYSFTILDVASVSKVAVFLDTARKLGVIAN